MSGFARLVNRRPASGPGRRRPPAGPGHRAAVMAAVLLLAGCAAPVDDSAGVVGSPAPPHAPNEIGPAAPAPGAPGPGTPGPGTPGPGTPAQIGPAGPGSTAAEPGRWQPRPGLTWQWQLAGSVDLTVPADVYDLDYLATSAEQVAALRRAGRRVICYLNAGAWEPYRPDAAAFPAAVLGRPLDGWPDERWLDIRRWDLIEPLLDARVRGCRDKGFDAVEPDNLDGYAADSGFPLSAAHQLTFNRRVAEVGHRYGLAVGLKNDLGQIPELVPAFDFAVNEQCAEYRECAALVPFIQAGKAVFHAEYELSPEEFCGSTRALGLSSIHKRPELDSWRETC